MDSLKAVSEIMNKPRKTQEEIMRVRAELSQRADQVYRDHCKGCQLLPEGVSRDSRNPVCEVCEHQIELLECGKGLMLTLSELKKLRQGRR